MICIFFQRKHINMWFPPELFAIIKSYMGFHQYYLLVPSKLELHDEFYDFMDETVKSKIWSYLHEEEQPVTHSIGGMLRYMIDHFDLVMVVTKRDWHKWRSFTLLMLVRTSTYQNETEVRMDICLDCFDRTCEECVRLQRLKECAEELRGKYKKWMDY